MEPQVLFNDVTVSRFGIDFKKTTLVVEYSSEGSTFLRKIRFKRFRPDANPEKVSCQVHVLPFQLSWTL